MLRKNGKKIWQKVFSLFFIRNIETNDLSYYQNWRMGLSLAASWSWGVSLAVGMGIMYTKGIIPFIIWATGNVLALPLFGLIRRYFPLSAHWPKFIFPMVVLFFFVEFFCIILNMQGLLNGLGGTVNDIATFSFLSGKTAIYAVLGMGLFVVWYVYKGGLRISVLTDYGQYAVQLIAVIAMSITGYFLGGKNELEWVVVNESINGLKWAQFGFFGIIVGALGTGHQWQRFASIKKENILPTAIYGGVFFSIYMVFVGLTGYFYTPHFALGIMFLITMIALSSSSIDSAVAGLEYVVDRLTFDRLNTSSSKIKSYHIATVIAGLSMILWPVFIEAGMVAIWTFMAKVRLIIVAFFIVITIAATLMMPIFVSKKSIRENTN